MGAGTTGPIALSCGEPAGIGPEIAAKAWHELRGAVPFFVIGDADHFNGHGAPIVKISQASAAFAACGDGLPVLHRGFGPARVAGHPQAAHAQGVIDAIAEAVELAQSGAARAICTLPIHKHALQQGAGFAYPGHTEYLAALAGGVKVVMMLACAELRVVPATIHIPLSAVPAAFTPDLLRDVIRVTSDAMQRDFGLQSPRFAVAGLNPHAGENGAMGREEIAWMIPCLEGLRGEGYQISGPLSADTMFHPAARARYDVAICAYHDQALIPIKTLDFSGGVNVTLGLPFIRTSPDHGTAFDIAGTGRADATSLVAALRMADQMAQARAA